MFQKKNPNLMGGLTFGEGVLSFVGLKCSYKPCLFKNVEYDHGAYKIDLIVVGSDRIAKNGDIANKIGTYSLAILAKEHGVPFFVAAPLSTFDLSLDSLCNNYVNKHCLANLCNLV